MARSWWLDVGFSVGEAAIHPFLRFFRRIDIYIQAQWIEDEDYAMDVRITDTWRSDNLCFFVECIFEFAFKKRGHIPELKVHEAFIQTFRIPQCQSDPLAVVHFSFEIVRCEVGQNP